MKLPKVNQVEAKNFQKVGNPNCFLTGRKHINDLPTCIVIDTGCTRAMGSRSAINRFIAAAGDSIRVRYLPCNTRMSFANAETKVLTSMMEIIFPTKPQSYFLFFPSKLML